MRHLKDYVFNILSQRVELNLPKFSKYKDLLHETRETVGMCGWITQDGGVNEERQGPVKRPMTFQEDSNFSYQKVRRLWASVSDIGGDL